MYVQECVYGIGCDKSKYSVLLCSLALQWCLGDNGKLYGKFIRLTPSGSSDRTLNLTTELIQVQRNRVINVKTRLSMRIYDTILFKNSVGRKVFNVIFFA